MPLLLAPHCRQPSKSQIPNSKSELPPPPQLSKSRQRRTASLISYSRRRPRLTHRIYLSIYCDHKVNTHIYTCQQSVSECLGNYLDFSQTKVDFHVERCKEVGFRRDKVQKVRTRFKLEKFGLIRLWGLPLQVTCC